MAIPTFPIKLGAITLRPFEASDFEDFCAYRLLPEVARYVPWPPHDRDAARTGLDKRIADRGLVQPGDRVTPAIVDTATGTVIGEAMLAWQEHHDHSAEIGYALHPDYHRRGIARAAAAEMMRIGFDDLGLRRVFGGCDARNGPSAALMASLGMQQEAHFRDYVFAKGEWCDELIFAILDDQWRAARK